MNRRAFLTTIALAPVAASLSCRRLSIQPGTSVRRGARVLFVSQGKTAVINTDGTGLRYFE